MLIKKRGEIPFIYKKELFKMRILNELKHCMLPSFYNNVMKILKQMENKELTEAETIEEIKKIYEWKDETIKKMISDYKKRFMNKKISRIHTKRN